MEYSYKCSTCHEQHEGLPFSYGPPVPAMWYDIPQDQRESRVDLSSDQCVIDEKYFFVLGRIEIPVVDVDEVFAWLVWVSLSEHNFLRMSELWEIEGRESEAPYFGWLHSSLPCYPATTMNLKTSVHTRPVGSRPFIELERTDHPLSIEQERGITMLRVQEIADKSYIPNVNKLSLQLD